MFGHRNGFSTPKRHPSTAAVLLTWVYGRCGLAKKSRKMVVLGWENSEIYIFGLADYEFDIFEFA